MLEIVECQDGLEHRNLDLLPLAGSLTVVQRHADARGEHVTAELVDDHRGIKARLTVHLAHQGRDTAFTLYDVVVCGVVPVRTVLAVTWTEGIDDPGIASRNRLVAHAQPLGGRWPHAVYEHVRGLNQ